MSRRYPSKPYVVSIVLLLLFGVGVVLYWLLFYTSGDVNLNTSDAYLDFERAFTAADLMTGLLAVISAIGLLSGKEWGILFGLVASGGILFLGFMDISYDLTHGIYLTVNGPMLTEVVINLFCIVVAPFVAVTLWRHRRAR